MADDTLAVLASELANVFEPLETRLASGDVIGLFTEFGLVFPAAMNADTGISNALSQAVTAVTNLPPLITALENALTANDVTQIVAAVATLIQAIGQVLTAITGLASALHSAASSLAGVNPTDIENFAAQLADALLRLRRHDVPPELLSAPPRVPGSPRRGRGNAAEYDIDRPHQAAVPPTPNPFSTRSPIS